MESPKKSPRNNHNTRPHSSHSNDGFREKRPNHTRSGSAHHTPKGLEYRDAGYSNHLHTSFDSKNTSMQEEENTLSPGVIVGRNAVRELLRSGRDIDKIFVQRGEREGSITVLVAQALDRAIPVITVDRRKLDELSCGIHHQGIVAMAAQKTYVSVEDLLQIAAARGEPPFLILAENINDPYNLGAPIRCAEGAGAHGLIIPKRHSVGISAAVTKASAGAVEHLAIAKTTNMTQTIRMLKERGVWVYAAEAGGTNYYDTDFSGACALVLGSEGAGVSRIVREACDGIVSIPMYGNVNSFNVATAGAVLICEVRRRRAAEQRANAIDS